MMFGEQAAPDPDLVELQGQVEGGTPKRELPGAPVLVLDGLEVSARRGELGLERRLVGRAAGEIMGVAGVDGNGQRELAEAVAASGRRPPATSASAACRSRGSRCANARAWACATSATTAWARARSPRCR